jgi:hypothetical protein
MSGLAGLFSLALAIPVTAVAQPAVSSPPGETGREGVAIGTVLTPALAGGVGFWPAVRFSAPLGGRVGLDVDAGRMFPASNGFFSIRRFYGVQIRLRRGSRNAGGSSRYWIVGPTRIVGAELDGEGNVTDPHTSIAALRLGYGGDQIFGNGLRAAGEIGVIGGGSSAPVGVYGSLVLQWRLKR